MKFSASDAHVLEGFRYLVMSGMSAVLSLGIPFALHEGFAVRPNVAVAIGLATAFVVNFITAKLFVFRRKGSVKTQLPRYTLISLAFRTGEYLSFFMLHTLFGVQYMIANASVLFLSFCVKFFVYKIFVFTHRESQPQAIWGR
jgi:putative flippase GtrA